MTTITTMFATFDNEIWKAIIGYNGLYEVSDCGNIRSVKTGKTIRQVSNKNGYQYVGLYKDGKQKTYKVHRLVALAFIPNPQKLPMVNHKDENKANNSISNLEWCDNKYNVNYGTSIERAAKTRWIPVIATDKNGNDTNYASIKEAAQKMGVAAACISQCCRRINGRVSVNGYTWRYADVKKHNYYVELRKKTAKKKATPVIAVGNDGVTIYFMSIKHAVESTGADRTSIIRSCRDGKYRSGGYKWHYASKQDIQNYSLTN